MQPHDPYRMNAQPQGPTFRVLRGIMVDSGTHNIEVTRPYTANVSGNAVEMFSHATDNGININRNSLAAVASSIIEPKAIPDAVVNIANGWNTTRILFMFHIEQVGTTLSTVLIGYADKADTSLQSNLLDPNLNFFFNSMLSLTSWTENTPMGLIKRQRVVDNAHLFTKNHMDSLMTYESFPGQQTGAVYTQRPMDIASNLSLGGIEGLKIDGRTQILPFTPIKSKRSNNSAPSYLAESIGAITNEMRQIDMDPSIAGSAPDIYNNAGSAMKESPVIADGVLRHIQSNSNYPYTGAVTWQQMQNMFPDIDARTIYVNRTTNTIRKQEHFVSNSGEYEYWELPTFEAIVATQILQTIPAFLTQTMLLASKGQFSNDNVGGEYKVNVSGETFIEGYDIVPALTSLKHRIMNELMPSLTQYGHRIINIAYDINLLRDAWIGVSINNGPTIQYSSPCYADALTAPTCVTNMDSLATIADTVNGFAQLEY